MKPLHRAARYDAFFPVNLESLDQFAEAVATVTELVGELGQIEDSYRMCYVRGPEGIIVGLVEQIG